MRVRTFSSIVAMAVLATVATGCRDGDSSSSAREDVCTSLRIAGGFECESRATSIAIVATNRSYCTGTFITRRHVLTAAHCVPPRGEVMVVATRGFSTRTTQAVKHPRFTGFGISPFDVAIVTIGTDAPVSPSPIQLSQEVEEGDRVIVYGYGLDEDGRDVAKRTEDGGASLKATTLDVASVSETTVRTLSDGTGDSCSGDSGGPVVREGANGEYGVIAIVRAGPNVCEPDIGLASENTNVQGPVIRDFILGVVPNAAVN